MKKLRLLKPWKLRTVRQRLCDERVGMDIPNHIVACCCPEGHEAAGGRMSLQAGYRENVRLATSARSNGNNAPVSYVGATIKNCRG